jgi:protein-tyrosine phosphatase
MPAAGGPGTNEANHPAVIDLHSHILPGLDDGAATIEDALAIVRAAAADGVRVLAATPHVRADFPTTVEQMRDAVDEVRREVARAGLPVEIVRGGEIALGRLRESSVETLIGFGLGGNPEFLLVEFPYEGWPLDLAERLSALLAAGVRPVLAHPERNPDVQAAPGRLAQLVAEGALVQLTASSLSGAHAGAAGRTAKSLLDQGLAHLVATDIHRASGRRSGMSDARRAIHDASLARWLTEEVPRAIVEGHDLPERPARGRRHLPLLRRRRARER